MILVYFFGGNIVLSFFFQGQALIQWKVGSTVSRLENMVSSMLFNKDETSYEFVVAIFVVAYAMTSLMDL